MPLFGIRDLDDEDKQNNNSRQQNFAPIPDQPTSQGISLMRAPGQMPGQLPSLGTMCCPGMKCVTFTTIISLFEMAIFIATLVVGAVMFDGAFVQGNQQLGPSSTTLEFMGGKYTPDILQGEVWRLITPVVLHAGVIHIASNLFFQMRFGYCLEARWGAPLFAGLYFLTGVGGCLMTTAAGPVDTVSVGASGALFGILGADVPYLIYNWSQIPQNFNEACFLLITILVNVLFSLTPTVDKWAHIGGFLSGVLFGMAFTTPLVIRPRELYYRGLALGLGVLMYVLLALFIFIW